MRTTLRGDQAGLRSIAGLTFGSEATARSSSDLARRHDAHLRHAQPSEEPDPRLLLAAGRRLRRPRRRRRSTWRVKAEGRGYYPITEKITFVGRVIGGHIEGWGGEDVRLLDLFFKGGETIRGFDRAGYGPRDIAHRTTRWAARPSGRRRPRCASRCPFMPDDLGISAAPCSPMPARCSMPAGGAKAALGRACQVNGAACVLGRQQHRSARRSAPA